MHSTRARKGGLTSSSSISALASISFFLKNDPRIKLRTRNIELCKKDLRIVNFGKHISDKSIHYQEIFHSYFIHKRFIIVKQLAFENLSIFLWRVCHGLFQNPSI